LRVSRQRAAAEAALRQAQHKRAHHRLPQRRQRARAEAALRRAQHKRAHHRVPQRRRPGQAEAALRRLVGRVAVALRVGAAVAADVVAAEQQLPQASRASPAVSPSHSGGRADPSFAPAGLLRPGLRR
jgi:hypothetical protein